MRRGWLDLVLGTILGLSLCGPALAGLAVQCGPQRQSYEAAEAPAILDAAGVVQAIGQVSGSLPIERARQGDRHTATFVVSVTRPPGFGTDRHWEATWFEVLLHPTRRPIETASLVRLEVAPPAPTPAGTVLTVTAAGIDRQWWPRHWDLIVLACNDHGWEPVLNGPKNGRALRLHASVSVWVPSPFLALAAAAGAVVGLYLLLALAAMGTQARQYAFARDAARAEERQPPSRLLFALSPVVIVQDSFGHASLARMQLMLFTLVLTGVYAYVLTETLALPEMSNSVLALLGITVTGSVLARTADRPVLTTPNRLWLLGTGVIDASPRLPAWRDLIAAEGEIDMTRVQALVFTLFAAAALAVNGTANLANFEIPDQINYLMGISQTAYIAGKSLPREAANRLNDEVRALREAEAAVLKGTDPGATTAFVTARSGAAVALLDVFGERFQDAALRDLEPGQRVATAARPVD